MRPRTAVLIAASAGMSVLVLDSSIVGTMIPTMSDELALSPRDQTWMVASYLLSLGIFLPCAGPTVDYLSPRRSFLCGCLGFAIASLGLSTASSATELIMWRAVAGLAAAVLMPASTALVALTHPDQRTRAIAVVTGLGQTSAVIGPALGGVLAQCVTWRLGFGVGVPVGLAAMLIVAGTRAGAQASQPPASAPVRAGSSRRRAVLPPFVVLAGLGLSMTIATVYGASEVQRALHLSPTSAGLSLLPLILAMLATTLVLTRSRFSPAPRRSGVAGASSMAMGLMIMSGGFAWGMLPLTIFGMVPVGCGIALLMAPMTAYALSLYPEGRQGRAAAWCSTGRQLGGALGVFSFAVVSSSWGSSAGFLLAGAVMLASTAVAWRIPRGVQA
ncbi:MFS transporter [Corynebacterium pacaense]|uniref:MFS transporter n=1 Tax=Corynebacterium pacaense TaxID=1816684 RepID=UPI0009BA7120|nr:MFS transporter [Corynebacterium pacaense]